MSKVFQAEEYRPGALGSFGDASYMLVQQHQFPDEFDPVLDKMIGRDHDRILDQDYEHGRRCFKEHTGTGEMFLADWLRRAEPSKVIDFLQDILKADRSVKWTGFRVLGSVSRGSGFVMWTLQLFSKHPNSKTIVHDSRDAPNLIVGSRHDRRKRTVDGNSIHAF